MNNDLTDARRTLRRRIFRASTSLGAIAVGLGSGAFFDAWAAGGIGVAAGLLAAMAWEQWDDHDGPDLVQTFEDALK